MDALFADDFGKEFWITEALSILVAAMLLVAVRLSHPEHARRLLRQPFAFLCAHIGLLLLVSVLPETSGARRLLGPLSLFFLLVSIGRSAVLLLIDVILGRRLGRPMPRIFRDILQGLVLVGIVLATLRSAGVEPGSLLTTSALLTAVIGLSLQDTLGNMFAGLAIQMQRPFDVGDWIQFDNEPKNIGKVVEINWRATKVVTLDEVEVIVPNGSLAKAPIKNFTKPTLVSRRSIFVHAPYDAPPVEVERVLLSAVTDAPGVAKDPPPSVVMNQFADSGIEYWVRFFTDQFHRRDSIDGGVRSRIWYAMKRAGIELPFPSRTLHVHQITEEIRAGEMAKRADKREKALRCVDFFRVLPDEHLHSLAQAARSRMYAPGEVIVRQGDTSAELYIIAQGEVQITVELGRAEAEGRATEVARLAQGKFFGEMALVTGARRQATVRAITVCELIEVGREAMQQLLERAPELAERISAVLVERQAALEEHAARPSRLQAQAIEAQKSELLGKIRQFFSL